MKSPGEKADVHLSICNGLVDEYIEASGKEGFSVDEEMGRLAEQVPDVDDARYDVNCQFFRLYSAYIDGDSEHAMELAQSIRALVDNGSPLDIRLPIFGSIDDIINSIQTQIDRRNSLDSSGASSVNQN